MALPKQIHIIERKVVENKTSPDAPIGEMGDMRGKGRVSGAVVAAATPITSDLLTKDYNFDHKFTLLLWNFDGMIRSDNLSFIACRSHTSQSFVSLLTISSSSQSSPSFLHHIVSHFISHRIISFSVALSNSPSDTIPLNSKSPSDSPSLRTANRVDDLINFRFNKDNTTIMETSSGQHSETSSSLSPSLAPSTNKDMETVSSSKLPLPSKKRARATKKPTFSVWDHFTKLE
uniref:Uncharacterized protein n=1 Tax=Cucumis melo TaxID=3656 RepID=A0A9I9E5U6_CUCME